MVLMRTSLLSLFLRALLIVPLTTITVWAASAPQSQQAQIDALRAQIMRLQAQQFQPQELGQQMLNLQIRHDRLWWAGQAGNWNLAYFMVGELNEALEHIEKTHADAAQLQPQKLSEVMPSIMDPAVKNVMQALAKHDRAAFSKAYDRLSASCTACHQVAGDGFLVIQRPRTRLLDNLRYTPPTGH
jgi:hypothetical protein